MCPPGPRADAGRGQLTDRRVSCTVVRPDAFDLFGCVAGGSVSGSSAAVNSPIPNAIALTASGLPRVRRITCRACHARFRRPDAAQLNGMTASSAKTSARESRTVTM